MLRLPLRLVVLFACMSVVLYAAGICTSNVSNQVSIPIASSGTLLFSRADVAFARTLVNQTHLKGNLGESFAEMEFLPMVMRDRWHSVTPRIGSQGIDHIFLRTTKDGLPRSMLIAESKYGQSQLGHTKNGIQMGSEWKGKRLVALGDRYRRIAKSSVQCARMPLLTTQKLSVFMPDGSKRFFWRKNSQEPWMFSGEPKELSVAQNRAEVFSRYFTAAGKGSISYRSRIFHIEPKGEDMTITILNADAMRGTDLKLLPKEKLITITGGMDKKLTPAAVEGLASELAKKMNMPSSEALQCAKEISRKTNTYAMLYRKSCYFHHSMRTAIKGSLIAGIIDMGVQLATGDDVSVKQVAVSMGVSGVTVATASGIQYWMMKGQGRNVRLLTKALKCSPPKLAQGAASALGIAGGIVYDVAMYLIDDNQTVEDLGQNVAITIASGTAAAATSTGLMAIATTWGTASTGTAISGLSGAAANSAALAWLGGGATATGGGGVAVGTAVVFAGAAVAAIIVAGVGYAIVSYVEKRNDDICRNALLEFYGKSENLQKVLDVHRR